MSYTDLRLVGHSHSAQLNRGNSMKKSRSLSLTNISSFKRNSYDHVESKVKRYIQKIKENNGQKESPHSVIEDSTHKMMLNIDADAIRAFGPLNEESDLADVKETVKGLTSNPLNLESKVKYISHNPEAVYCLLHLLFEERKLRYEQDLTMKTLQLNYDNLLAKFAYTKNSIDSFRLSQEVLTDLKSNSSFLSGPIFTSPDIKKAFSTPDLSFSDISIASNQLIKNSFLPVVDPNFGIKLCIENLSENNPLQDNSPTNSAESLKTIWVQIFKNLREKLKKCVLLEKNFALEGEDKRAAWSSIQSDFKCLYDIANYQEDIKSSFGDDLEDIKFVIHKFSLEYLGSSLITNDYINPVKFLSSKKPDIFTVNENKPAKKPQIETSTKQTRPERTLIVSNRENDSGCLTSDCSPHPSLNEAAQIKPYYTTSNNINSECKQSDGSVSSRCKVNYNISSISDGILYSECSTRTTSSKNLFCSGNSNPLFCSENVIDNENNYQYVTDNNDYHVTDPNNYLVSRDTVSRSGVYCKCICQCATQKTKSVDHIISADLPRSPSEVNMRTKFSAIYVKRTSSPDSTLSSSRPPSSYDFSRLDNNCDILKKQLECASKREKFRSTQRKSIDKPYKKIHSNSVGTSGEISKYRSLRKHRSMHNIDSTISDDVFEDDVDQFCTSTPIKKIGDTIEKCQHLEKPHFMGTQSREKRRKSSLRHKSKSLSNFGKEIKEVMEITESLKNQSRDLLMKYKKRSDAITKVKKT